MVVPYSGFKLGRLKLYWMLTATFLYILLLRVFQPVKQLPERVTTAPELARFLLHHTQEYSAAAAVLAVPLTLLIQFLYHRAQLY